MTVVVAVIPSEARNLALRSRGAGARAEPEIMRKNQPAQDSSLRSE
jgi:hypothetical protein